MRRVAAILADLSGFVTDAEGYLVAVALPGPDTQGGYLEVRRDPAGRDGEATQPRIIYRGPAHLLTNELAAEIKYRRAEIVRFLEADPSTWTAQDRALMGFGPDVGIEPVEESRGVTLRELEGERAAR